MTVGVCLDLAGRWLGAAAAAIRATGDPQPYEADGCLAARELVYHQLGRLLRLAGIPPPVRRARRDDTFAQLQQAPPRTDAGKATALWQVLDLASVRPPAADTQHVAAQGELAARIANAARSLAMAGDILATHPTPPRAAGPATVHMAPGEVVGELARLAGLAVQVDQAMSGWNHTGRPEQRSLRQMASAGIADLLQRIGASPPSPVLRATDIATPAPADQPAPVVRNIGDLRQIIDAARIAVHGNPNTVTIAAVAQAARLGFVLTVAAGRLNGPHPQLTAQADRHSEAWRALAHTVNSLGDQRANASPVAANLAAATVWMRRQLRDTHLDPRWDPHLTAAEQDLRALCHDMLPAVNRAVDDGLIQVSAGHHQTRTVAGVRVSTLAWAPAHPHHHEIGRLRRAMDTAAALPATRTLPVTGPFTGFGITAAFPHPVTTPPPTSASHRTAPVPPATLAQRGHDVTARQR